MNSEIDEGEGEGDVVAIDFLTAGVMVSKKMQGESMHFQLTSHNLQYISSTSRTKIRPVLSVINPLSVVRERMIRSPLSATVKLFHKTLSVKILYQQRRNLNR